MTIVKKLGAALAMLTMVLVPFDTVLAAGPAAILRQEVNVNDAYFAAQGTASATSSAIILLDPSKYSGTVSYYFEVLASSTQGISPTVFLSRSAGGAHDASVTVGSPPYTLVRSAAFTPPGTPTQYVVNIGAGTGSGTTGVKSARIVVVQNIAGTATSDATSTETQIEIGNEETYTSSATSSLASPKYWYYNAAGWDGGKTFYAEVTYANTIKSSNTVASSTTYSTAGTFNVAIDSNNTTVQVTVRGGGGGGGAASTNNSGSGSGGAGGQYATKSIAGLAGLTKVLVVGNFGAGGVSTLIGTGGGDSTWDTNQVVAKGGAGGNPNSGTAGAGSTTGGVGTTVNAGGNGAAGVSGATSGGGGEGGGSSGTGGNASGGTKGSGTDGGDGGTGQSTNGTPAAASQPGGGGAGARSTGTPNADGGAGGVGQAVITDNHTVVATTTITLQEDNGQFGSWTDKVAIVKASDFAVSTSTRARSVAFTPTDGKHYRIVFSEGFGGATHAIYNAKIIVDQQASATVDVLVIGGGGGGGQEGSFGGSGGGGGAGGLQENASFTVSPQVYTVTVGAGGAGQTGSGAGGHGATSTFDTINSDGGGGGGGGAGFDTGIQGGSGGGGDDGNVSGGPGTAGQGTAGGSGTRTGGFTAGGGGGAGAVGSNGGSGNGGAGGAGSNNSISGGSVCYAGGGGGGKGSGGGGTATCGGGAASANTGGATAGSGTANTGGGGGGTSNAGNVTIQTGGDGGSGTIIISYPTGTINATCGGTPGTNGSNTLCTFNSSATFTVNTATSAFTKVEAEYQLAPTPLAAGTAQQVTLESFNTTEWSNAGVTYLWDIDSGASSASVVLLNDSTGATTYATVTSPNNEATSTLSCVPTSNTTWDSKASTNNGDIYGVRVIARVVIGGSGTSDCAGGTPAAGPQTIIVRDGSLTGRDATIIIRNR